MNYYAQAGWIHITLDKVVGRNAHKGTEAMRVYVFELIKEAPSFVSDTSKRKVRDIILARVTRANDT